MVGRYLIYVLKGYLCSLCMAFFRFYNNVGRSQCTIVDTYWQTETGAHIATNLPGKCLLLVLTLYQHLGESLLLPLPCR